MNVVCGDVERQFAFGSLQLVDQIPQFFPGSPSELPFGDVPFEIWIGRGDQPGKGNMGITTTGGGICRMRSLRMFLPGEDDWFNFRHIPLHEFGHVHGLAASDFPYKMANMQDGTPLLPHFGIAIANPADEFWATHADLKLDPMFNAVPEPHWCALHRRILLGEYRIPHRMVPVPLDVWVFVVDALTNQPVEADVYAFDCDMDNTDWRLVANAHGYEFRFRRWENESYQSNEAATLIKAYAPGYLPRCFWWSSGDAQRDTLNGRDPTIVVRMKPAAPKVRPVGIGSTSNSHVSLAFLEQGEHYLISVLADGKILPVKSFEARAATQREEFDHQLSNFYSVSHLPGVSLGAGLSASVGAGLALALKRPAYEAEPLCEMCSKQAAANRLRKEA